MSPPSPRAERRDIGWPAARSTVRWSASIFDLVSMGARMLSWSGGCGWSLMVVTFMVGRFGRFGQQDRSGPLPLAGDRLARPDRAVRVVGAGPLFADEHPGAAVERGEHLDLGPEIHLRVDDRLGGVGRSGRLTGHDAEPRRPDADPGGAPISHV